MSKVPDFTEEQLEYLEDTIFNQMQVIGFAFDIVRKKLVIMEEALKTINEDLRGKLNGARQSVATPLPPKHKFSDRSKTRLNTCHEDLQKVFYRVVKQFDCTVIDGHRNKERQNAYYRAKKSKKQWPNSKHNTYPSMAVDVAPCPIDWEDIPRFRFFAGYVIGIAHSMGIRIRWGGDWDSDTDLQDQIFNDLGHFELVA